MSAMDAMMCQLRLWILLIMLFSTLKHWLLLLLELAIKKWSYKIISKFWFDWKSKSL